MITRITCFLLLCLAATGCKKKDNPPALSSSKQITSFILQVPDNPGVISTLVRGDIGSDTIVLPLSEGTIVSHLVPTITTSGASVSPASKAEQDFSSPVIYTVTAADGSTKRYVVVARYLSSKKEITSFVFTTSANAGLTADIVGSISGDTIVVRTTLPVAMLKPTIVYTGVSLTPDAGAAQDFSSTVSYTVGAADGSARTYTVFVSSNLMVYTMGGDGYLYALDAASGRLVWKNEIDVAGGAGEPPTYSNGRVYVSGVHLMAFDGATGARLWEAPYSGGGSLPVVANGRVYGFSTLPLTTPYGVYTNNFAAFDAATGSLLWQQNSPQPKTLPLVAAGKAYIGSAGYGFYIFDAATGAPAGQLNAGIVNGNPAYANGSIYTGGEWKQLASYSAATGAEQWTYPLTYYTTSISPSVSGDTLVYSYADTLYEVSTSAHILIKTIAPSRSFLGNPLIIQGTLYVGDAAGNLYAIDAATGRQKWKAGSLLPGGYLPVPVVANNTVYAGSAGNYFCAYDVNTGAVKWRFLMGNYAGSGACITDVQGNTFHPAESGEQN